MFLFSLHCLQIREREKESRQKEADFVIIQNKFKERKHKNHLPSIRMNSKLLVLFISMAVLVSHTTAEQFELFGNFDLNSSKLNNCS